MALDNTDPNIALAAGNIPNSFQQGYAGAGQNLNQMLAMQLRMQQLRQVQQSENALRQLYGNPGNLDESGRPTTNAMGELMRADPRTGLQLQGQIAELDQRKAIAAAEQLKVTQEHKKTAYGIGVASLEAYDDVLNKTGNERAARQKMEEVRAQMLDEAVSNNTLDKRVAQGFPPADPTRYRALKSAYEAQNTKPMTAYQGQELGIQKEHLAIDKARVGLEAKRIDVEQDKNLFEGKDSAGKDRTVRMGDGGGWVDAETNEPVKGLNGIRKVGTKAEGGADKGHPAREVGIVDKDGNVVERVAANEVTKPDGTSEWYRAGSKDPVKIPEGGHIDVGQAAGVVMGSREAQMLQRQLGSGVQALKAMKDIVALPSDVSRGYFGGREQGKGLMDAAKESLVNKLTTQDVQAYNAITPGVTKALAFIDSQGLAPGVNFTNSFNAEMLKEGDTVQTKMLKLARQREIIEGGMETLLTNPRLAAEQKKKAESIMSDIKETIPWTPIDVIKLMRSNDPKATLRDVAEQQGLAGEGKKDEARSTKPNTMPSGIGIYQP